MESYKSVDSFDKAAIRHKITDFYTARKQLPTKFSLGCVSVISRDCIDPEEALGPAPGVVT